MSEVVSFSVGTGQAVFVETDNPAPSGGYRAVSTGNLAKVPTSFEDALDRVRPAASALLAKMRELDVKPDELEIEFGIKLSSEVGALIAKTSGEANFTVKLLWKKSG